MKMSESKVSWLRKFSWLKEPAITNWLLTIFTLLLAVTAALQWHVTDSQLEVMRGEGRAWLSPLSVQLASSLESGFPVKYQVHIANLGRQPALGIVWNIKPRIVPYIPESGHKEPEMGANTSCQDLTARNSDGVVVYPQEGNTYVTVPMQIDETSENKQIIESTLNRTGSLVVEGCFAYIADRKSHTSAFRYFLRDMPNVPSFIAGINGQPNSGWRFNATLTGNDAN